MTQTPTGGTDPGEDHAVVHGPTASPTPLRSLSPGSPDSGSAPRSAHSPYSLGSLASVTGAGSTTGRWRTSARARMGAIPGWSTALERTVGPRREARRILGSVSVLGWIALGAGIACVLLALVLG